MIILLHTYTHVGLGTPTMSQAQPFWLRKTHNCFLCSWRGSNLGSLDLKSDTLPTEPPGHPSTSMSLSVSLPPDPILGPQSSHSLLGSGLGVPYLYESQCKLTPRPRPVTPVFSKTTWLLRVVPYFYGSQYIYCKLTRQMPSNARDPKTRPHHLLSTSRAHRDGPHSTLYNPPPDSWWFPCRVTSLHSSLEGYQTDSDSNSTVRFCPLPRRA